MKTRNQGRVAPMKTTCELDDTFDEDTNSYDGDKENEVNALKTRKKRKDGSRTSREGKKKGLSKRHKVGTVIGQESPPIFTFRTKKTSFRKRKTLKLERQAEEEEKNKKRIEDLVAYFKNLDAQKLETA
ncbi:unnamed protein product [Peronospora destructor]|uniref:Uncharacterized protein n=1 Tax=Peronospora destructor TaxID=86335 RepID=A0AAV0V7X4_9STRA|nr:unnamed protein product [Peronospora destructor]